VSRCGARRRVVGLAAISVAALVSFASSASGASALAVHKVAGADTLAGVTCTSASACWAVGSGRDANGDDVGVVVRVGANGVPGAAQRVAGPVAYGASQPLSLRAVACSSASACVAVGTAANSGGAVVPIVDGHAGKAQPVADTASLTDVACRPGGACVAVGGGTTETRKGVTAAVGAVVPIAQGTAGTAEQIQSTGTLSGIDCAGAATCYAVGSMFVSGAGAVVPIPGTTAGTPAQVAPDLSDIDCVNAHSCVAVGTVNIKDPAGSYYEVAAVVPVTHGRLGPVVHVKTVPNLVNVGCASTTSCVATWVNGGGLVPITRGVAGSLDKTGRYVATDVAARSASSYITAGSTFGKVISGGCVGLVGAIAAYP
jgi:hypothetical protein